VGPLRLSQQSFFFGNLSTNGLLCFQFSSPFQAADDYNDDNHTTTQPPNPEKNIIITPEVRLLDFLFLASLVRFVQHNTALWRISPPPPR
jgi:hypothetical protein